MLRTYVTLQQYVNALRGRLDAEDGTTAPEYMLVLGFISLAFIGVLPVANACVAITSMSADLADKISP